MRSLTLAVFVALGAATADAQRRDTTIDRSGLPRDVAREATRLFNEAAALRATDRLEIEEGRTVDGDVAVLGGPVLIGGRVRGRVLAINSDVILRPTAHIDGDLLVVGGEVEGRHVAYVGGEIRIYRQRLTYVREGDRIAADRANTAADETDWWRRWEHPPDRTGSKLQIASAGAYNRVEGLPINLGPQIYRNEDWGTARLDAYAVLRTKTSFSNNRNDIGHNVSTEVRIGQRGGLLLGGQLFNVVEPTETWQLSELEAGLSTFLFRSDFRDYFTRRGGRVRTGLFLREGAEVSVSYGHENWGTRDAENPWTLSRQGAIWRPNPTFDEAQMHLFNTTLRIDTRNDPDNPWSGWYVLGDLENGLGHILSQGPRAQPVVPTPKSDIQYARAFVDLRRYNRVSPDAQLNFRIVAGGFLSGDPLPLQRRFAVDGPGALPGYAFRVQSSPNVQTCSTGAFVPGMPGQCDRMALAQVEYRGDLRFGHFTDWEEEHYVRGHSGGVWVFFADAGRGWLVGTPSSSDSLTYGRAEFPALSTFRSDLGVGLDFDIVGVFVAKPMSVPTDPLNFFIRIRHRF